MKEVKVVGYVGNPNRYDYDQLVAQARSRGIIAYDLMNTAEEHVCGDIRRCDKIYIVGENFEINELAQDIISYAYIMQIPVTPLNGITEIDIRHYACNFCMNMAEGLMLTNMNECLDDFFKGENG